MRLIYSNNNGHIENQTGLWQITISPLLGFDYFGVFYDDHNGIYHRMTEGGRVPLSQDEMQSAKNYLNAVVKPVTPPPTQAEFLASAERAFTQAVQNHLEQGAKTAGYDDIISACSYAGAPNPFQAESQSFVSWRGNVWAYCYQELNKVKTGVRPFPSVEQIISELPIRT